MDFANLPPQCPPNDAIPCTGEIFRLVSTVPATTDDFISHFNRYPGKQWLDECEASGLSISLSFEAASRLRKRFKKLPQEIAVASLQPAVGVMKQTHSAEHHTWWPEDGVDIPVLFNIVKSQ
jgi:hypothetical protein